jgi:acetyl-CoA carboxylase carboxyl transferase beta subunit
VTTRIGARDILRLVLDDGSFVSWDEPPIPVRMSPDYAADLARARVKTGLDESVISGEGCLHGRRVAVMVCEFGFLAGSIGVAAAERLVLAIERATRERIPLLAFPVSGGTRMQEGTVAFLQMVKIAAAVGTHRLAGLPYLVYLRDPTTGGTLASWGSLGHVTVAEPGALIGFLGPRVYEAIYGEAFPDGVQRAENLYAHGLVDAVVAPEQLAEIFDRALNVLLAPREGLPIVPELAKEPLADIPAWESITRSRRPERPGARRLLTDVATDVVLLNGTGEGEAEPGLILALARFGGAPAVVLGQDPRGQSDRPLGPGALRGVRRGIRLAQELDLPLVMIIDTPGAALSREAEEGGLATEIARCLAELVAVKAPTLSLLIGQGCGGGALALVPADRVLAAQHAWLSPLPPEGASALLHHTTEYAADMARAQGVRSLDLLHAGIVDRIIAEHPDSADEPDDFCRRVGQVLQFELVRLLEMPRDERHTRRLRRYRSLGLSDR